MLLVFLPQYAGAATHTLLPASGGSATEVDDYAVAGGTPTVTAAETIGDVNAAGSGGAVAAPPTAPRTLAADPGDEEVVLTWMPPASDGGAEITHYEYRYAQASETLPDSWTVVEGGEEARRVTVDGLTNDTTYRFEVRAVNEEGPGAAAATTAAPADADASPELAVPDLTVNEGDGTAVVRVTLAPAADETVTVSYVTAEGSASPETDYTAARGTLTFPAGSTAREIPVIITNDKDVEGEEDLFVALSDAKGADIGRDTGQVTIQDNDPEDSPGAPSVPVGLVAFEGDEVVRLTWRPPADDGGKPVVRYEYRFREDTLPYPGSWTVVSQGAEARRVTVRGLANGVRHEFQLRAVNEVGAGSAAEVTATPMDDDPPPSMSIDDISVSEGSDSATLRVRLSRPGEEEITVKYATSDGTAEEGADYTGVDDSLTFAPGVTVLEINVAINDDNQEEENEGFTVDLSDARGARIDDGTGDVTILDNDGDGTAEPPDIPRDLGAEPGDGEVTVSWAVPASDGGAPITRYEYRHAKSTDPYPDSWTTVPGGSAARRVTVSGLSNGTQYDFEVRAVNEAGEGQGDQVSATPSHATGEPRLAVRDAATGESDGVAVVRVTLSHATDEVVTVRYDTEDLEATAGLDYSRASGTVSFNPGDTLEEIRVPIVDDEDHEASERFVVRLMNATNATIEVRRGEVIIRDDDANGGADVPSEPRGLLGIGGDRQVELTWSQPLDDGGAAITRYEYRFVAGSKSFPAAWTTIAGGEEARRLRVTGLTNGVTHRFQVRAVNSVGAGAAALTEGTPVHPDSTPTIRIRDADVGEGDDEIALSVIMTPAADETVRVRYVTADGTATAGEDYTDTTGTLVFSQGTNRRTITVPVLDDDEEDGDETFSVTLSLIGDPDARIAEGTATVTIRDNEGDTTVTVPSRPRSLFGDGGDGMVTLTWREPESDGGAAITHYEYRWAEDGEAYTRWAGIVGGGRARKHVVKGLSNGVLYRFQVRAVNKAGPGESAETVARAGQPGTPPSVTVNPEELEIVEDDSASYTVVLESEPFAGVTVRMTADLSDTDLEVQPTEVVFTPSNWHVPQEIAVRSEADDDEEDDLGIVLTHEASGGGYDDVEVPSVTVDILDLGARVPVILGAAASATETARGELVFVLLLSEAASETVSADYETVDGTAVEGEDYEAESGTVVFPPGTTTQRVRVRLVDDDVSEEDETLALELFNPVNATLAGGGERLSLEGVIVDDDEDIRVSFGAEAYVVEEGGSVSVEVELSDAPDDEIRIPIEVTLGEGVEEDEFSVAAHVIFEDGETRAELEFEARGDDVVEEDEMVFLMLGPNLPEGIVEGDPVSTEVLIEDDDERGVSVSPETLEVTEGDSATYTARLTSQPTGGVTVRMTTDLAETSLTVEPVELAFTPDDWNEPRTVTVHSALDPDVDDELGIVLTHETSGGDYDGVDAATVTVDVIDLKLPTVEGDDARAEEAAGVIRFPVRLNAASRTAVRIRYATADGTALAGEDYEAGTGVLTFRPGATLQVVAVTVLNDYLEEEVETFRLELFDPVGATLGDAGDRLVLTGTIADDDETVTVSFGAGGYEVDEGGSVELSVEVDGDPGRAVRVPIVAAGGRNVTDDEFTVAEDVLVRQGQTSATFTFRSTEDHVDEDDEIVTLRLGSPLPEGLVAGDPTSSEVTVVDDDERGVEISATALEVDEGGSAAYTVQLTSRPTATVTVEVGGDWAGSDVTVSPSTLTFAPRAWRNPVTVTVSAAHDRDAIDEPAVTLSHNVTGGDYTGVTAADVTVTVIEDDTPVLTVPDAEGVEGDGEIVFEATLDIQSSREVRVGYVSAGGTATEEVDYAGQRGTLVFAPLQTSTRFMVPLIDDDIDEPAEHFRLEFSNYVNASPGEDPQPTTGTILDDDLPVLTIDAVEATVVEGTDARVRLVREGDLTVTLSVPVTVIETGDFLAGPAPGEFDFAVGAAEAILALPTVDDALDERDGTIEATIPASDDYEISGSPTVQVAVSDNDATPTVNIAAVEAAESAGEIAFPVTLRGASAYEVTVSWATADRTAVAGEDYRAATGTVTFAPGETVGELRVTVLDDVLPEGRETFTVTLSGPANAALGVPVAAGTIIDDDEMVVQAWLSRFGRTVAGQVVEGIGERVAGGMGSSQLSTSVSAPSVEGEGRRPGLGDVLDGSMFHLGGGSPVREAGGSGGGWAAWGRGMRTSFDGAEEGLSVDGSVLTALAGVDYEAGPVLAGVAGSYSLGEGTLARSAGELSQDVESTLSSVYPYLRVRMADRVSAWGLGGFGRGEMSFPGAGTTGETGIGMQMGALGARGDLMNPAGPGISLALKSDAFLVRMSTDESAGTTPVETDASRVRFLLEAASHVQVGASGLFAPLIEVGVRMDGGDAETGTGLEVGGGLKYTNEAAGLSVEGTGRVLVSHQDTAFSEWGVGGALIFQPGGPDRGLSVSVGTSWGAPAGSARDLWSPGAVGGVGAGGRDAADSGGRFMARLHYVMSPFGSGLSMAPYAELGMVDGAQSRTSLVGWRLDVLDALRLNLEADLRSRDSAQGAGGLSLRVALRQ